MIDFIEMNFIDERNTKCNLLNFTLSVLIELIVFALWSCYVDLNNPNDLSFDIPGSNCDKLFCSICSSFP